MSPTPLSFHHLATQLPLFGWSASFPIVLVVSPNPRLPRSCHYNPTVVSHPPPFFSFTHHSSVPPHQLLFFTPLAFPHPLSRYLTHSRFLPPSLTLSHPLSLGTHTTTSPTQPHPRTNSVDRSHKLTRTQLVNLAAACQVSTRKTKQRVSNVCLFCLPPLINNPNNPNNPYTP
jgi:hypothetical protein